MENNDEGKKTDDQLNIEKKEAKVYNYINFKRRG
jgi:hypothetical protein